MESKPQIQQAYGFTQESQMFYSKSRSPYFGGVSQTKTRNINKQDSKANTNPESSHFSKINEVEAGVDRSQIMIQGAVKKQNIEEQKNSQEVPVSKLKQQESQRILQTIQINQKLAYKRHQSNEKKSKKGVPVYAQAHEEKQAIIDKRQKLESKQQQMDFEYSNQEMKQEQNQGKKTQRIDPSKQIKFGETKLSDYQKLSELGKGTYGQVNKCLHTPSGIIVAIKAYFFENVSNGINYSTLREVSLLKSLAKNHEFVKLLDVIKEIDRNEFKIFCVFEYCESTLSKIINQYSKAKTPFTLEKIQKMMKQLLGAIDVLHSKMILHRDIKPDNILLDSDGNLKLADFGLAKKASFFQRRKSNTIVSLWYRAPEIILGSEDYFISVDIWSIGCIFAELMTLRPLFYCQHESEVLEQVFSMFGTPTQNYNQRYLKLPCWGKYATMYKYPPNSSIQGFFPFCSRNAIDLLEKMLCLDPKKRITAKEALMHPFFQDEILTKRNNALISNNGNNRKNGSDSHSTENYLFRKKPNTNNNQ